MWYDTRHEVDIEVKLDRSAQEALDQIREKGYAEKYRASGRRITLMGMNFSSETRQIGDVLVSRLTPSCPAGKIQAIAPSREGQAAKEKRNPFRFERKRRLSSVEAVGKPLLHWTGLILDRG